ncbi:Chitinase [Penicillium ucsense]|uniref:chitinase n=1 Tax=Penicillium ucsense TaxID=2839758 RepID=A0A8J8W362_9EURO|nr:Chitinase [Penicillium ucsense]KAF7730920.1 Chitinase [Penicillium ucsense]
MRLNTFTCLVLAAVGVQGRHERPAHHPAHHQAHHPTEEPRWTCVNAGASTRMKTVGYFGNWDIYGANYRITDVPAEQLTHLTYAFANINTTTGAIILSDTWADLQFPYPGDNTTAAGNNVYGNVKQMYLLKKTHRTLKTMLSIGGWSYRQNFAPMLASATKRQAFVDSAVQFVADLGFDGIDIDYEYVADKTQAAQMVDVLQRLRQGLDQLACQINASSPFQISYASPANVQTIAQLDLASMIPLVDFLNVMAVDYQGPGFSNYTGYLANLFPDKRNPRATDFDTVSALDYYLVKGGVPSTKIVMQNPLYGRSFNGTRGMGDKFIDGGSLGSLGSAAVWRYRDLPIPGFNATVVNVPRVGGSYSYDAKRKYLVSYDTPQIATLKAEYTQCMGLAGTAWWEVSQDRNDSLSLISATVKQYGGFEALDQSLNNLDYPTSVYENLRAGFSGN